MKNKHVIFTFVLLFACFILKAQDTTKLHMQKIQDTTKANLFKGQDSINTNVLKSQNLVKPKIKSNPQPDSIIRYISIDLMNDYGVVYTIGGKLVSDDEVKAKLLSYKPSAYEFHKAMNNLTWSWVSFLASTPFSYLAVKGFNDNSKYAGATTGIVNGQAAIINQNHSNTKPIFYSVVAGTLFISSLVHFFNLAKHAKKSVALYNSQYQ